MAIAVRINEGAQSTSGQRRDFEIEPWRVEGDVDELAYDITKARAAIGIELGKPWKIEGLKNAWCLAMRAARADSNLPELVDFLPRRLRASFVTLARRAKADVRILQRYVGHAPKDVLGEHYEVMTVDDMRREVVDKVAGVWTEAEGGLWQDPGIGNQ